MVHRGGNYEIGASECPAANRTVFLDLENEALGFRVVLYK